MLFTDKTGTLTEALSTFDRALTPPVDRPPRCLPWLIGLLANEVTITSDGPVEVNVLDQSPRARYWTPGMLARRPGRRAPVVGVHPVR